MDGVTKNAQHLAEQGKSGLPELYSGMRLEVLTTKNHLIFMGILRMLDEGVLQITEESGQSVPRVEYNTKIKLRGFQKNGKPFSMYGMICGSTIRFWRVDRLETLQTTEQRGFFRQSVSIEAQLMKIPKWDGSEKDQMLQAYPCRILDISGSGMLIRCKGQYEKGDLLYLSEVRLAPGGEEFILSCRIQRVIEGQGQNDYGCSFEGMSPKEEDRLLREILELQRRALHARRNNEDL